MANLASTSSLMASTLAFLDSIMQAPDGPEEDPTDGVTLGNWMLGLDQLRRI